MKLLAAYVILAVMLLWAPVAPRVVAADATTVPTDVSQSVRLTVVQAVPAPVQEITAADSACGVAGGRTVSEWLNQAWCTELSLQVVTADTNAVRIAVIDAAPTLPLVVQYAQAVLRSPTVRAAQPVAPVAVEAPTMPVWTVPRLGVVLKAEVSSAISSGGALWTRGRPVAVLLRC